MTKLSIEDRKSAYEKNRENINKRVIVCAGTGCIANGALGIYQEFLEAIEKSGQPAVVSMENEAQGYHVSRSGCQGFCQMGPLVTILPERVMYCLVKREDVTEIVEKSLLHDDVVERLLYHKPGYGTACRTIDDIPFYKRQHRLILKHCGIIDSEDKYDHIL
ncbi:MAG: Ferredoxin, 2Fe-2S [Pelotomaculum sp. PtaB.Bin104]|nr:MAG: Ferredoxin, 2Fe-2S [Pelotomaculum sp. PtaB.Bin104]